MKKKSPELPVPMFNVEMLLAWPPGYEHGKFRVIEGGVLLYANGRPALKIADNGQISMIAGRR